MRRSGTCPKCGGQDIGRYLLGPEAALFDKRFVGPLKSWVMAYTCQSCHFIELYAEGAGILPPKP